MFKSILILLFFVSSLSYSQWIDKGVNSLSSRIGGAYFFDSNTGFAVGDGGVIIKTTSGGDSWIFVTSNTSNNLHKVVFVNSEVGFIVGGNGIILRTSNSGNNWNLIPSGLPVTSDNNCNNVSFANATTGYIACTSGYLKTTDAGLTWNKIYSSTVITYGVNFINANTGIGIGDNSLIMRTTNGGINWSFIGSGTNYLLDGIDKTADNTFYIAGGSIGVEACVMKSTNMGLTWDLMHTSEFGRINQLHFINNNIGYAVGASGTIIKTTNAGTSWFRQFINTSLDLWDCSIVDPHIVILTGSSGKVYKTINGGSTGIISNNSTIPDNFELYQNYPNPFNPTTKIKFDLAQTSKVSLKIYTVKGVQVETLVDNNLRAGNYTVDWDASKFNSGIYFYKLETLQGILTKKMMLVK